MSTKLMEAEALSPHGFFFPENVRRVSFEMVFYVCFMKSEFGETTKPMEAEGLSPQGLFFSWQRCLFV